MGRYGTVHRQHAPRRRSVAAQLHCLNVSVPRLPGGLDTGTTLHTVLGIRDILMQIRILGSVPLPNRIQLRIRETIIFFHIIFSYNLPAGT